MITLETERLIIRNFKTGDWEALHETIAQYDASGLAAYDQPWPTGSEEIKGVVQWFASGDDFLAVTLKEGGRFIGFVALNPEQHATERQYNLGYVFNFDYHGQGYATEACRAVLAHAFEALRANSIITGTAALNTASRRLLERLGFRKTAEAVDSFRNDAEGKPIGFLGCRYYLSRQDFERK